MRYTLFLHLLVAAVSTHSPKRDELRTPAAASSVAADSIAEDRIREELRGYYRDLRDRNWTSMVTHFYPAKVTARFAVPSADDTWSGLSVPPIPHNSAPAAGGYCEPAAALVIVGQWARVLARRCTGEIDEAWFYSMSGRWKIIHLESGATLTAS